MAKAKTTTEHSTIRAWVEERGGCPAQVKGTGTARNPGIIRIDYTGFSGKDSLQKISWKKFFEAFESNNLAFLYQDEEGSRFSKLVSRDGMASGANNGSGGDAVRQSSSAQKGADALQLLEGQHRDVERLFEQLEEAESAAEKRKLFLKLADMLAAHAKIEETIFYPTVFSEETEDELREAVEEHLIMKRLIADLLKTKPSEPQYMGKIRVLRGVVEHHVEEEEGELFQAVRKTEKDDLSYLGERMQRRFTELMLSKPHEQVPKETRAAAQLG